MKNIQKIICILTLLVTSTSLFSQDINTRITVVSPYEPSISDAEKIKTLPVFDDLEIEKPNFNYSIQSEKLDVMFTPRPINPAKMLNDPQSKLYKSYLKLGLGNYFTPLIEFNTGSLRSKEYAYGVYVKHQSSSYNIKLADDQKIWAGYSDNIIRSYGKRTWTQATLTGDASVKYNTLSYYGFNTDSAKTIPYEKKDIRQEFLTMGANVAIESNFPYDSNKLYYHAFLGCDYITDKFYTGKLFENFENGIHAGGLLKKNINGFYTSLNANVDHYHSAASIDSNNNLLIKINPTISKSQTQWTFRLGLNTVVNAYAGNSKIFVYPDINFEFSAIQDVLRAYFGINGDRYANNYAAIISQNPFVVPTIRVRAPYVSDMNNIDGLTGKTNVYGGLKGSLSNAFEFNLAITYSKIVNQYFFVNDTLNRNFFQSDTSGYIAGNQFIVVYDDVDVIRYLAECNIIISPRLHVLGKLDVHTYTTFNQEKAWHLPGVQASLSPQYNLRNKILVNTDFNYIGKRYARSPIDGSAIELKQFLDLNLGVEYRYTKMLSVFVRFNNLSAYKNYLWNQYPIHRFHLMAGFSYTL